MRIISQNRDLSIDFDRTPISVNYNHVLALVGDKERVIGQYETTERAREVFERIHKPYSEEELKAQDKPIEFREGISTIQVTANNLGIVSYTSWVVYEMPKE